jgi:flagellar motor switch/type III secretory pathway protein FliN
MIPYKPLELSRYDVEVLEELIFSKRLFPLAASSQKMRFVLPPESNDQEFDFFLSLKTGQHPMQVALKPTNESDFIKCLSEFGGKEAIPKDFLTAVTAFCSRKIIHTIETFLQLPVSLVEKAPSDDAASEAEKIYFEIINDHAAVEVQGEIKIPLLLLQKILSMAIQLPRVERSDLAGFSFQGELVIGTATLSPAKLSKLMPGDLVFFEEPSACSNGEGFFYFNKGQKVSLSLDVKQLQSLIHPLKKVALSGFVPSDISTVEEKISASEQELASLETLVKIELALSAGTLSLSMDEVMHLAQTKKLSHAPNVSGPIKMLAQGTFIGTGELVELHGQHAIFITQLNLTT